MDSSTGHLVRDMRALDELHEEGMLPEGAAPEDYEPLPSSLSPAAEAKLRGEDDAFVSMTSGGKLSRHAAARRAAKRKSRLKMARNSRRRNRSKK